MRKLIILITLLVIGFGLASAKRIKTDYKHPVRTDTIARLVMSNDKTDFRYMSVDVDKYNNYFITISRFENEEYDEIQIKVVGKDYRIKFGKTIKVYELYYPKVPSYTVTTIGSTTTVKPEECIWYYFRSIYPISKELYDLIKNKGIEEMKVDGIPPIIVKKWIRY